MGRVIKFRKEFREFGWGKYEVLDTGNKHVLAHTRKSDKGFALVLHNFSAEEVKVKLKLEEPENIQDVFGDKRYEQFDPKNQEVKLSGYGYRWLHKIDKYL